MSSFWEGAWTWLCPQGRARSDTRLAPALRLSRVQAAHQRAFTAPSTPARTPNSWTPASGSGTRRQASQRAPHPMPHSRAGARALGQQITFTARADCRLVSRPAAGATKGPRDPGQKRLWAAWVRAPDCLASGPGTSGSTAQSRESHHRLRDVCGCPRRVGNLGRHTKPDLREGPRGPPGGSSREARSSGGARTGAGRP